MPKNPIQPNNEAVDNKKYQDIFQKMTNMLVSERSKIRKEDVTLDAEFITDLKMDSLDFVETVMSCEEIFGIMIPEEDAEKIHTVKDMCDFVYNHMQ